MDAMACMVREPIQLNKLIKLLKRYFQVRKNCYCKKMLGMNAICAAILLVVLIPWYSISPGVYGINGM